MQPNGDIQGRATAPARPFRWTGRTLTAARLVAEDLLSDHRIAARVGVDRRQLTRWRQHPEFAARVNTLVAAMGERSLRFAIARQHRRVKALNERWEKLKQIVRQRAAAPEMANVPGGTTGLLVRKVKSIGAGDNAREVEEFEVDTGLLKEIRELEKQAAQELGQWDADRAPAGGVNLIHYIRVNVNGTETPGSEAGRGGEVIPELQLPHRPAEGVEQ